MKVKELADVILYDGQEIIIHDRKGERVAECTIDDIPAFLNEVEVHSIDIVQGEKFDVVITFTNNLAFIDYMKECIHGLEESIADEYRILQVEDVNDTIKNYAAQMETDCCAVVKAIGENKPWDSYIE